MGRSGARGRGSSRGIGGTRSKLHRSIFRFFNPRPFSGVFKTGEDVSGWFDERGVRITNVRIDPEGNEKFNEHMCKSSMELYAKEAAKCSRTGEACELGWHWNKRACDAWHRIMRELIADHCGIHID